MKWINAEHIVTVEILDEEHEERISKTMSIEDMLDAYTAEGCPSIYSQPAAEPQRKKGTWMYTGGCEEWYGREYRCSECGDTMLGEANYCPNCGADMRGGHDE